MKKIIGSTIPNAVPLADAPHWYVLRSTYGREKIAYDYLTAKGINAFYPTTQVVKQISGKRKVITVSRFPNIFFAYATEEQLKSFVYDNVNLSFLRFYYRHSHIGNKIEKFPMIVPEYQMEDLRIICASDSSDVILSSTEVLKFKIGQLIKVAEGKFKGFVGHVARWKGQQRVGIVIDGFATVVTAYVPSASLRPMGE